MAAFNFHQKKRKLDQLTKELPKALGQVAVTHFTQNFRKQGFDDVGVKKWKDVKRRDPNSEWYGYRSSKVGNKEGIATFSKAATTAAILTETGNLKKSIFIKNADRYIVRVGTNQIVNKYAKLHNEGGYNGNGRFVPQRKFMGASRSLEKKMKKMVSISIKKILG